MADYFAHESAYIGENTKIWHFSHILSGSNIGNSCSFGQNCVVGPNVKIGSGVKVQNNVSIYEGVEIEDAVFVGPSAVFTNVINPRAFIARREEFKKTVPSVQMRRNHRRIGSGAVINRDVKPYALMVGVPAKRIGWVSRAGNRLDFNAVDAYDDSRYRLKDENIILIDEIFKAKKRV